MNSKRKGPPRIAGNDDRLHKMYIAFGYHRVTSRLRGDGWDLDWATWRDTWLPYWDQRGRGSSDLCMARIDFEQPWTPSNIEIITRKQHTQKIRKHYQ